MARPLVMYETDHPIRWSSVYLDAKVSECYTEINGKQCELHNLFAVKTGPKSTFIYWRVDETVPRSENSSLALRFRIVQCTRMSSLCLYYSDLDKDILLLTIGLFLKLFTPLIERTDKIHIEILSSRSSNTGAGQFASYSRSMQYDKLNAIDIDDFFIVLHYF